MQIKNKVHICCKIELRLLEKYKQKGHHTNNVTAHKPDLNPMIIIQTSAAYLEYLFPSEILIVISSAYYGYGSVGRGKLGTNRGSHRMIALLKQTTLISITKIKCKIKCKHTCKTSKHGNVNWTNNARRRFNIKLVAVNKNKTLLIETGGIVSRIEIPELRVLLCLQ